jgi:hypothetical protein
MQRACANTRATLQVRAASTSDLARSGCRFEATLDAPRKWGATDPRFAMRNRVICRSRSWRRKRRFIGFFRVEHALQSLPQQHDANRVTEGFPMSLVSRISKSLVLAAAAVTTMSFAAGCSFNPDLDSRGSKGVADFSMSSSQCALGCGLDKPVAQGASIRISVSLTQQHGRTYSVRIQDASMGTAKNNDPTCSIVGSSGSKSDNNVPCDSTTVPSGSSIEIDWSVDIQTAGSGKLAFDVIDDQGTVVDSGSFDVHAAASIDTTVNEQIGQGDATPVTAGKDGAFTVKVSAKVDIDFVVKDSSGTELAFTEHGVVPSYSNTAALKSDPNPFNDILGATDTEYALADGQGDAAISFDAHTMTKTVSFHVVP